MEIMIGLGWDRVNDWTNQYLEKLYVGLLCYIGRGQYTNIKVDYPWPENNSSDINTVHLADSLQATRKFKEYCFFKFIKACRLK